MRTSLKNTCRHVVGMLVSRVRAKLHRLPREEHGAISILSVITLLMLTMLLGMIMNVGEQIDDKIKMQNAADAATYSGGVVIARGLNTLTFTNRLMSETFALAAYFREGRDRYAESLVPEILDAWKTVGEQLGRSDFQLIRNIQPSIAPRIEMEREMVRSFGDMTAVKSRLLLPPLETILGIPEIPGNPLPPEQVAASHLIPVFQRAVVLAIPTAAAAVTKEIASRNTPGRTSRTTQFVLWNTRTVPVLAFNQFDPYQRLLPGLDPTDEGPDARYIGQSELAIYQAQATQRRRDIAFDYLSHWNNQDPYRDFDLVPFEREHYHEGGKMSAKMSNFIHMWRGFTQYKLNVLLTVEYPHTNLPHMLRMQVPGVTQQQYLDSEFTFDGAVYRQQRQPTMPGMYRVPITGDAFSFARVSVYIPKPRFRTNACGPFRCIGTDFYGTTSCENLDPCTDANLGWGSPDWDLFNQNWAAKMIPTSAESTLALIQTNPQQAAPGVTLPNVNSIQLQDLKAINFH